MLDLGRTSLKKSRSHLKILGMQKCEIKEIPHIASTYIRRRPTKFCRHGDLATGIYALLC